mmetsp:Transcript_15735/g.39929  ORF Transcript_15735/g.39929 Transcript_15735/m.39929 type:complete len:85 (-) Transcript_15735:105-359(-)|eukprot:1723882-Prymnesium_polylepis.1
MGDRSEHGSSHIIADMELFHRCTGVHNGSEKLLTEDIPHPTPRTESAAAVNPTRADADCSARDRRGVRFSFHHVSQADQLYNVT